MSTDLDRIQRLGSTETRYGVLILDVAGYLEKRGLAGEVGPTALSNLIGITRQAVHNLLNQETTRIQFTTLAALCDAFEESDPGAFFRFVPASEAHGSAEDV